MGSLSMVSLEVWGYLLTCISFKRWRTKLVSRIHEAVHPFPGTEPLI